jgi:hypothetical protein
MMALDRMGRPADVARRVESPLENLRQRSADQPRRPLRRGHTGRGSPRREADYARHLGPDTFAAPSFRGPHPAPLTEGQAIEPLSAPVPRSAIAALDGGYKGTRRHGRLLRACESFDSAVFRRESNQGLTEVKSVESRIDSQTLRCRRPNGPVSISRATSRE